jgi:titin
VSGQTTTSTTTVPAAPSNLRAGTVTSSSIHVLWTDNASTETGVELAYRPAGGTTWTTASLGANTTTWTHSGLSAGASYTYQVRACNSAGCSAWSTTVTAQTTANTSSVPAAPSNLRAGTVTSRSIQILWTDNATNETSFQVAYTFDGTRYVSVAANTTTWTLTGITPGYYYYFYVRACNSAGCSAWSNGLAVPTWWSATAAAAPGAEAANPDIPPPPADAPEPAPSHGVH